MIIDNASCLSVALSVSPKSDNQFYITISQAAGGALLYKCRFTESRQARKYYTKFELPYRCERTSLRLINRVHPWHLLHT